MTPSSQRIFAGGLTVLVSFLLTVGFMYESSPFYLDVRENSPLRVILLMVNLVSVFVTTAFRSFAIGVVVFAIQWFALGFFLTWLLQRIRVRYR